MTRYPLAMGIKSIAIAIRGHAQGNRASGPVMAIWTGDDIGVLGADTYRARKMMDASAIIGTYSIKATVADIADDLAEAFG